jgi:hypothetical protein
MPSSKRQNPLAATSSNESSRHVRRPGALLAGPALALNPRSDGVLTT